MSKKCSSPSAEEPARSLTGARGEALLTSGALVTSPRLAAAVAKFHVLMDPEGHGDPCSYLGIHQQVGSEAHSLPPGQPFPLVRCQEVGPHVVPCRFLETAA